MNIITKYILLFDCVNSSFSDRCVRRRKELRKRRGCARFPFLSFFPPHISLSLSFSFFNRDEEDDERSSLSKSLCYRFPSGCATVCLPCTPSSRCLPPSRCILQRIRSFRRVRFFNSSRGGEKKGAGGKKKRRKEPVQRLVGWLDGETPIVFRSLECPCTRGNTNPGSYASCAIDLSLQGSCLALYSIDPGHSRTLILDLLCVYFYICIP